MSKSEGSRLTPDYSELVKALRALNSPYKKVGVLREFHNTAADAIERLSVRSERTLRKRQYYYRVDACKADFSQDPDCICWHDEGTGPLTAEEQKDASNWRESTPPSAAGPTIDLLAELKDKLAHAHLAKIDKMLNEAGVRRISPEQAVVDRVYDLLHNGAVAQSATARRIGPETCDRNGDIFITATLGTGDWYCNGCGASHLEPRCKYRKSVPASTNTLKNNP